MFIMLRCLGSSSYTELCIFLYLLVLSVSVELLNAITASENNLGLNSVRWSVKLKKVSHCQIIKKSYLVVSVRVNEIRFLHQIRVPIKHWSVGIKYSVCDLLFDINNYDSRNMSHIR